MVPFVFLFSFFLFFFWVLKVWRNLAKEKRKKVEFTLEKKFQNFPNFFVEKW
jgi:hypothetical protein